MKAAGRLALCVVIAGLAGCVWTERTAVRRPRARSSASLERVTTVLVLPFANETGYAQIEEEVQGAVVEEIAKAGRFRLLEAGLRDERLAAVNGHSGRAFTLEELAYLHRAFGAEAVLRGRVTSYRPYPRTEIGLDLAMTDLTTGEALWSIAGIWDAQRKGVAQRARRFYEDELRDTGVPYGWELVVVSPALFRHFVGYEVALTLGGRVSGEGEKDAKVSAWVNEKISSRGLLSGP